MGGREGLEIRSWHAEGGSFTYCVVVVDIDSLLHIGIRRNEEVARCHLVGVVDAFQRREGWCK